MASKETINFTPRDMDRLIDWMRRSGRPQAIYQLAHRYVEMLREERGIRDNQAANR